MPTVRIACFHEHLTAPAPDAAIVAIDVIRATTTAVTAVLAGHRVYPAGSIEAAVRLAADLDRPLLVGELGGVQPYGFDIQNSPTEVQTLEPSGRPMILLSTSGTRLISEAASRAPVTLISETASRPPVTFVSCLRNAAAQGAHLAGSERDVAIFGADSRGEFREEDQLCAARIARVLVEGGHQVADDATDALLARWGDAPDDAFLASRSVRYLRDTGQEHDLRFVLGHIDDVQDVFVVQEDEIKAMARSHLDHAPIL